MNRLHFALRLALRLQAALLAACLLSPSPARAQADSGSVDQLIKDLGSDELETRRDAAYALAALGPEARPAVPALVEALNRRDVDVRAQAHMLLQQILGGTIPFDPYAPEAQRRQQVLLLNDELIRKAG